MIKPELQDYMKLLSQPTSKRPNDRMTARNQKNAAKRVVRKAMAKNSRKINRVK